MKHFLLLLGLVLMLAVGGCGSTGEADTYPRRSIKLIVPSPPGGGVDLGARALLPHLEKELGVPVVITNLPGKDGWAAWMTLLGSKPDGYTLAFVSTPNLITSYLNPENAGFHKSLEDFEFIANQVMDYTCIIIRAGETRFTNMKELMEYAAGNGVTAFTAAFGSDGHLALLKINRAYNTNFVDAHAPGLTAGFKSLRQGRADAVFATLGEAAIPHIMGELKIIAVVAAERSVFLPEVPTLRETGFPGVYSGSSRGVAAPKGLNPAIKEKLDIAFRKAIGNFEHHGKMERMGFNVEYMNSWQYKLFMMQEEVRVRAVADILGWSR